jgi:hypothetical protein
MESHIARRFGYHAVTPVAIVLGTFLFIALQSQCYSHGDTTCGQENSPLAPLRGNVTVRLAPPSPDAGTDADGSTNGAADAAPALGVDGTAPAAGSLVFVELCDLYSENPDPSKGHPNYRYVALADGSGNFLADVPKGTVGLHTLLEGYLYGSQYVADSTAPNLHVQSEPLLGRAQPQVSQFTVTPAEAQPGTTLTFSMNVKAAPNDPISDEVLLAEPSSGRARAFAPPRRGSPGKGFPDGTWTVTLAAPSAPGTYTYYAQAVSEQCAVSTRLTAQVTVR